MEAAAVVVSHGRTAKCGAQKRQGGDPCRKPAGWGTEHNGSGRCRLHGGNMPTRHGRYSGIKRAELRDAIAKHEADPNPLNILPELAATRALFEDFINRYHEYTDALLAWHSSYSTGGKPLSKDRVQDVEFVCDEFEAEIAELSDEQRERLGRVRQFVTVAGGPLDDMKPRRIMDIADAQKLLAEIRQQVATIEHIDAQNAISRRDLFRVLGEMGRTVDLLVTDDFGGNGAGKALKTKIKDSWNSIRLA